MSLTIRLKDSEPEIKTTKDITIETSRQDGVLIGVQGCGLKHRPAGYDRVIQLFYNEGNVKLLVYGDINNEDPTHEISLHGALEHNRKEDPDE